MSTRNPPWGNWHWDPKTEDLVYTKNGRELYYIGTDSLQTAKNALDWIYQLHQKTWLTDEDMRNLIRAIDWIVGGAQGRLVHGEGRLDRKKPRPESDGKTWD